VVCWWDTDAAAKDPKKRNFETIYTYFPATPTALPRVDLNDPDNFDTTLPKLSPYFIDPTQFPEGVGLAKAHAAQFVVKSLLIDPYTPLHLYSAILPIKGLQLPGWTLNLAMKNMSKFDWQAWFCIIHFRTTF
jgi:hypothetical protein